MSDPLSEIFTLLDITSAKTARLEAGGQWALQFPAVPHLKFNAILKGECWIRLKGGEPVHLQAGDTYLLAGAPPYLLSGTPQLSGEDVAPLYGASQNNSVHYGGNDIVLLGGGFTLSSANSQFLLDTLPAFIHVPHTDPAAAVLKRTLHLLDEELANERMGSTLMTRRLADILLVQVLRAYVTGQGDGIGWLGALSDPKIGRALKAMHAGVSDNWTVEDLAQKAGMSRASFAHKFRQRVGVPPLEYLTRWRMEMARDALARSDVSVSSLAATLGYSSESAFTHAFKRVFGRTPKRYWAQVE